MAAGTGKRAVAGGIVGVHHVRMDAFHQGAQCGPIEQVAQATAMGEPVNDDRRRQRRARIMLRCQVHRHATLHERVRPTDRVDRARRGEEENAHRPTKIGMGAPFLRSDDRLSSPCLR